MTIFVLFAHSDGSPWRNIPTTSLHPYDNFVPEFLEVEQLYNPKLYLDYKVWFS